MVPETHEEAAAEATENKDEITNADKVNEVDEATASDIAEFDVKPENQYEEEAPAKEEEIKNERAENKDE